MTDREFGLTTTPLPAIRTPQMIVQTTDKEWVGLTGYEVNECAAGCHNGNSVQDAIRKAEAKLREKNT